MDLIQNNISNKEGKKWKQRWAVLKRKCYSAKDSVLSLILYKDASHAKLEKEKVAVPLLDYCGLNVLSQYEKFANVLVLITASQTYFMSFDSSSIRDEWQKLLVSHFGEDTTYEVTVTSKSKLKSGSATLRIYQTFFSIIKTKNFLSIGRWFCNDVSKYAAINQSQFMFEIVARLGTRTQIIELQVQDSAEDIVKAFESVAPGNSKLVQNDFRGSLPDELDRSDRDNNFFQRCLLRVSNRVRKNKNKRERARTGLPPRKDRSRDMQTPTSSSMSQLNNERIWQHSIERRKSPDLCVNVDEDVKQRTIAINSKLYHRSRSEGPRSAPASRTSEGSITNDQSTSSSPRKMTNTSLYQTSRNEDVFVNQTSNGNVTRKSLAMVDHLNNVTSTGSNEKLHKSWTVSEVDSVDSPRHKCSVDSTASSGYNVASSTVSERRENVRPMKPRGPKNGKKKHKSESDSQPTPPPRSPVSLGLTVFEFPSCESLRTQDSSKAGDDHDSVSIVTRGSDTTSLSLNVVDEGQEYMNLNGKGASDDGSSEEILPPPPPPKYSDKSLALPPLPTDSNQHNHCSAPSMNNEPVYGNIDMATRQPMGMQHLHVEDHPHSEVMRRRNFARARSDSDSDKHKSDPLLLENFIRATGEGSHLLGQISSLKPKQHLTPTDYVNIHGKPIRSNDDEHHGSYVNVAGAGPSEIKRKTKPAPLAFPQNFRNDFEKYDDEDTGIYHDVPGSSDSGPSMDPYENVNQNRMAASGIKSEYSNLMSPKSKTSTGSLNYVLVGSAVRPKGFLPEQTSPVSKSPVHPKTEQYIKSDYTMIDENLTEALQQSKLQLQKQREEGHTPTKTPNKKPKQ